MGFRAACSPRDGNGKACGQALLNAPFSLAQSLSIIACPLFIQVLIHGVGGGEINVTRSLGSHKRL